MRANCVKTAHRPRDVAHLRDVHRVGQSRFGCKPCSSSTRSPQTQLPRAHIALLKAPPYHVSDIAQFFFCVEALAIMKARQDTLVELREVLNERRKRRAMQTAHLVEATYKIALQDANHNDASKRRSVSAHAVEHSLPAPIRSLTPVLPT
ncbi:hypothetical protein H310_12199 [Aphanomyces invadans]|uniref:Uncharacterized protein n=1 Tax=Aphanomyces invadans TaxID=157072 RepID=A0A024TKJ1_9STRA|nr:hypothetical protein H310_12199 [Aphanomyces invadans]ETV93847.1 hypothetical protein H310_12199 [Aphanomyces invadans]|eukprot:XP_008877407.1 hypothetical protein H310_12199 [Aphanomyces invadans]